MQLKHTGWDKKTGRPQFLVESQGPSVMEEILGESPTARVWGYLFVWKTLAEGTKSGIAKRARISRTSLYKVWPFFIDNEIIIHSKFEKGKQYYKLNEKNYLANKMFETLALFFYAHVEKTVALTLAKDKIAMEFKKIETKRKKRKRKYQRKNTKKVKKK